MRSHGCQRRVSVTASRRAHREKSPYLTMQRSAVANHRPRSDTNDSARLLEIGMALHAQPRMGKQPIDA